jgi:hypothetical protein
VLVTPYIVSGESPVPELPQFNENFKGNTEGFQGKMGHTDGARP